MKPRYTAHRNLIVRLDDAFLLAVMLGVAAILTAAMTLQYAIGELPCPLCLLERVALFGVCFGILLNFRCGYSGRNTGCSLLFAVLLLVVSVRQTLLDIYPRPGHAYIGSAIFGIHMPVWSIIIAVALLTVYALKLALLGGDDILRDADSQAQRHFKRIADLLGLYVVALVAINFVSVILQCGLGECHTFGYKLLGIAPESLAFGAIGLAL
ncbi:MAG TPA: disulfide bond formation protein B [Casimicrobiaceae bacterium]|nr:disulfide bond formation protein B [Casimicrobiaceae bacterium]